MEGERAAYAATVIEERRIMSETVAATNARAALAEQDARTTRELFAATIAARQPSAHSEELRELKSVVDVKLLEKLEVFDGQDSRWESWLTGFEALTGLISLDDVMTTALEVANKLAAGPVDATRLTKRALNHWIRQALPNFEASLAYEMLNFLGPDAAEGLAALKEKRAPNFHQADETAD